MKTATTNSALDELTVKSQFLRSRIPKFVDDKARDDKQA
jgi:hypothetical protein